MNGNNFESKKEFDEFIKKITLEDVVLVESNSKVISLSGRVEDNLESNIDLTEMDFETVINMDNMKDFLIVCTLGCDFSITKNTEQFLKIFTNVQAIYRVENLDIDNYSLKEVAIGFAKESAYLHIISFLRVYIMDIVNKSGYPRYVLPLFKQIRDTQYEKYAE